MEDENNNFEEQIFDGFAYLKETLMKVDESSVHEEFDSLTDAEKLFIFAKKLIIPKEDFDAEKKIIDLLKKNNELMVKIEEQDAKFGKIILEKETEIAGLNDNISYISELVEETAQQRDEFSDLCSQRSSELLDIQTKNQLNDEDAYAFEVKYNSVRVQRDELHDANVRIENELRSTNEFCEKQRLQIIDLQHSNTEKDEEIARLKAQLTKLDSNKTQRLLALKQSIKDLVKDSN